MRNNRQVKTVFLKYAVQPLGPFNLFDLRLNPNRTQLVGHDLPAPARIGWRRKDQRDRQPIFKSSLPQERFSGVRIMIIDAREIDIGGMVRCKMAPNRRSVAKHRAINDRLPVNGPGNRAPDPNVA